MKRPVSFQKQNYTFSGGCNNKSNFSRHYITKYLKLVEAVIRLEREKKTLASSFQHDSIQPTFKMSFCAMWKHKPLEGSSEHNRSYWTTITVTSQIMRPKTLKLFRSLGNNPQTILKFIKSLGNICEHNCCLMDFFMQIFLLVIHKFSNSRNLISVLKSIKSSL